MESETVELAGALVLGGVAAGVDALELVLLLLLPHAATSRASGGISNSADLLTHSGYRCVPLERPGGRSRR